jgi:hypothetical protein
MMYFDPLDDSKLYGFYKPKPWKIIRQYVQRNGLLEVLLERLEEDPRHKKPLNMDIIDDIVGEKAITIKPLRLQ